MISGDLLSAFPHRQFHTLPGLLDSWAALPNSNPNACMPMQGGSLYHFYDGLWYDPAERRTHDLPCERRTRYRLSQPDTVWVFFIFFIFYFFCGVLSIHHMFGPGPKLVMNIQHSTLRIHTPHSGFPNSNTLSVECWVSVISLEPGLDCMVLFFITSTHTRIIGPLLVARSSHISDGIWLFQIYSHTLTMMWSNRARLELGMFHGTKHVIKH